MGNGDDLDSASPVDRAATAIFGTGHDVWNANHLEVGVCASGTFQRNGKNWVSRGRGERESGKGATREGKGGCGVHG